MSSTEPNFGDLTPTALILDCREPSRVGGLGVIAVLPAQKPRLGPMVRTKEWQAVGVNWVIGSQQLNSTVGGTCRRRRQTLAARAGRAAGGRAGRQAWEGRRQHMISDRGR